MLRRPRVPQRIHRLAAVGRAAPRLAHGTEAQGEVRRFPVVEHRPDPEVIAEAAGHAKAQTKIKTTAAIRKAIGSTTVRKGLHTSSQNPLHATVPLAFIAE